MRTLKKIGMEDEKGRFDAAVGKDRNRAGTGRLCRGNNDDGVGCVAGIVGVLMRRRPLNDESLIGVVMVYAVILFILLVTRYCG